MKKPEIASRLAKQTGISLNRAMITLRALFSTRRGKGMILTELEAGREFRIVGFGTFRLRKRRARTGRNPKTGEAIRIPPRRYVVFHAGAGTRELMTDWPGAGPDRRSRMSPTRGRR